MPSVHLVLAPCDLPRKPLLPSCNPLPLPLQSPQNVASSILSACSGNCLVSSSPQGSTCLLNNPLGPWNKGDRGSVINVKSPPAPFSLRGPVHSLASGTTCDKVDEPSRPLGAVLEYHVPAGWVSGFQCSVALTIWGTRSQASGPHPGLPCRC